LSMTFDVEQYITDLHDFLAEHPTVCCKEAVRRWERFICFIASKARREAFREALARLRKASEN
jgi:hypothetical protein